MNGRTKYASAAVVGALVICLFAVMPAFGAGEVSFIEPVAFDDENDGSLKNPAIAPDEQEWARQGGFIGLMYEDDRLNRPIRRVLTPYLDTTSVDSDNPIVFTDVKAHDNTIAITITSSESLALAVNDYVIIGEYTVRKVRKIAPPTAQGTNYVVTLDRPFYENISDQAVHKIKQSVIDAASGNGVVSEVDWHSNYGLYAKAVELERDQGARDGNITRYSVGNYFEDSDIATTPVDADDEDSWDLARRLTGKGNDRVNLDDALILSVDGNGVPFRETTYIIQVVRNARIEFKVTGADRGGLLGLGDVNTHPELANHKVYLAAWFEERNDTGTAVSVYSQAHPTDMIFALSETLPNSGKFALKIKAVAPDDFTSGLGKDEMLQLPVNPRDVVIASTAGSTGMLIVESFAPAFTGLSPSHNYYVRDARAEVLAQVTDFDSGVKAENIRVLFLIKEEGKPDRSLVYTPAKSGDVDEISGGFRVRSRLRGADAPSSDATISWWIMATDDAGNVGFSDRETAVDGEDDTCLEKFDDLGDSDAAKTAFIAGLEAKKCDPYAIHVDRTAPKLLRAETGRYWNSTLPTNKSADKTEYRVSKADKTSVMVVFDSHLDAESVSASDFEVNGAWPRDAVAYNVKVRDDVFGTKTGDGNSAIRDGSTLDVGRDRGYVFLRLPFDMSADATPNVELVGAVMDLAGNELDTGEDATALDRIAPTLTVATERGRRPVTNDSLDLTISADENIGAPNITFRRVMSRTFAGKTTQTLGKANEGSVVVKFVSATEYRASINIGAGGAGGAGGVGGGDGGGGGLFTVVVEATDAAGGNTGIAGDDTAPVDVGDDTDAVLFEFDVSVPHPDVNPDLDGVQRKFSTEDPNALIRIDFSSEANEYDDRKDGDDLDTHRAVTIVSATLDGEDISGSLQANDAENVFMYRASGLAIGDYKLEVAAEDAAGNRHSTPSEAIIAVRAREPFSLKLNPGWNLVSIPGEPANSAIDAVIPLKRADITSAFTYEPSESGQWVGASRGADGIFEGELRNITAERAYWIESGSFKSLKVDIPKPTARTALVKPTIPIAKGWNMVPILDSDGDFELSFPEGRNYFSGLTSDDIAVVIDTFNTIANRWEAVAPEDVEIGKGYWVSASADGIIIP